MTRPFIIPDDTDTKLSAALAFVEKYDITTSQELQEVIDATLNISMLRMAGTIVFKEDK